jgi:hypothetical protein
VGLARLTALLTSNAMNDPESFPTLDDLLPDEPDACLKAPQSAEQMLAIMRGLARRTSHLTKKEPDNG